jgi:hypothetical protein
MNNQLEMFLTSKNVYNMKKNLIIGAFLLISFLPSSGQDVELIPYIGYEWSSRVRFYDGEIRFRPSENYGIALNIPISNIMHLNIEYMHQPTQVDIWHYSIWGNEKQTFNINNNWFQVGGLKQIDRGKVSPFGGMTFGAAYYNPQTHQIDDKWKFAVTTIIGAKFYLTDKIGLRLHGRLLFPIQWTGLTIGCGTGGCGTGVSAGSYFYQGDIGAGLIFRLGGGSKSPGNSSNTVTSMLNSF